MPKCLIAIGSNFKREQNMHLARRRLMAEFPSICFAKELETEPIHFENLALFSNQVAVCTVNETVESVKDKLKSIEREAGRKPEDKALEKICLDIDLLAYGQLTFKQHEWQRKYIVDSINELKQKITLFDMNFLGIIPARYASTRFPAKPLAMLGGKTVIQRVYEQVANVLDEVYVATDDERIEAAVLAFGGKVVMTSIEHRSGTDRCYEALTKIGGSYDVVVNVQGDEPFIQPSQLEAIKECFTDEETQIATLVKAFSGSDSFETLENVNSPKVVVNKNFNALYFSRSIIPYQRNSPKEEWVSQHTYYKHIGLYAYKTEVLKEITELPQSALEIAESLEQLRWLENGYRIKVGLTEVETIGIDTPEDLERAETFLKERL